MQGGWVYIVTNRPNGTLYIGVTSDLARRAWEHREGVAEGSKRYGLKILVYAERHDDIRTAIQRERNLKHWSRAWKVRLILADNPDWNDLRSTCVSAWMAGSSPAMARERGRTSKCERSVFKRWMREGLSILLVEPLYWNRIMAAPAVACGQ
jgi:putative endonuclease